MKFAGLDIETWGTQPEYALQPWRAKQGKAWLTSIVGLPPEDTPEIPELDLIRLESSLEFMLQITRRFLIACAEQGVHIATWNGPFDMAFLIALGLYKEVMACKWIDGLLLYRHYQQHPTFEAYHEDIKNLSFSLKAAVRQFIPEHAGYEEDVEYNPVTLEQWNTLRVYNRRDVRFTMEIVERLWWNLTPAQRAVAMHESKCLPMMALSIANGIDIDTDAAESLSQQLRDTSALKYMQLKLNNPEVSQEILASPAQLAELLKGWGLPVAKLTAKGAFSTDKDALDQLAARDPRAKLIAEIREAKGNCTKFAEAPLISVAYNGDGHTYPVPRVYGTYCVPGDTEVLTPTGWQSLETWDGGDIVQAEPDGTLKWAPATRFIGPLVSEWVGVRHRNLMCDFTGGHTVPYMAQKTQAWRTCQAANLLGSRRTFDLPLAGTLSDKYSPDDHARLLCAAQADGYWSAKGLRFTLVKPRKIARLRKLLAACGVSYREYTCPSYPDRVEFHIHQRGRPGWLTPESKVFGPWCLQYNPATIIDELVHWDGSPHPDGGVKYASHIIGNLEWVRTLGALCGRKVGMSSLTCHISDRCQRAVASVKTHRHVFNIVRERRAYCATTETGFWLARANGTVFITGNSGRLTYSSSNGKGVKAVPTGIALHQWKRGAEFRKVIKPPEGFTLCEFDFSGQEFRWMAVQTRDQTMLSLCAPGEDAHAYMGSMIAQMSYPQLRKLAKEGDAEAKKKRQHGKLTNLSCQYAVGVPRLMTIARVQYGVHLSLLEAETISTTYRRAYRGVPAYWKRQRRWAEDHDYVENMIGRRVHFLPVHARSQDYSWSYGATAINFPIQSIGADQKYLALSVARNILPDHNAYFYYELHDGLFFIVPHLYAKAFVKRMKHVLSNLPYEKAWGLHLPIQFPVDAKFGPSWGELEDFND